MWAWAGTASPPRCMQLSTSTTWTGITSMPPTPPPTPDISSRTPASPGSLQATSTSRCASTIFSTSATPTAQTSLSAAIVTFPRAGARLFCQSTTPVIERHRGLDHLHRFGTDFVRPHRPLHQDRQEHDLGLCAGGADQLPVHRIAGVLRR